MHILTRKELHIKIEDVHFNRRQWKKSLDTNIFNRKPKTVIKKVPILWLQVIQSPPTEPWWENCQAKYYKVLLLLWCMQSSTKAKSIQLFEHKSDKLPGTNKPPNQLKKNCYTHNIQLPVKQLATYISIHSFLKVC